MPMNFREFLTTLVIFRIGGIVCPSSCLQCNPVEEFSLLVLTGNTFYLRSSNFFFKKSKKPVQSQYFHFIIISELQQLFWNHIRSTWAYGKYAESKDEKDLKGCLLEEFFNYFKKPTNCIHNILYLCKKNFVSFFSFCFLLSLENIPGLSDPRTSHDNSFIFKHCWLSQTTETKRKSFCAISWRQEHFYYWSISLYNLWRSKCFRCEFGFLF